MKSKYFLFERQYSSKELNKYYPKLMEQTGKYRVLRTGWVKNPQISVYCVTEVKKGHFNFVSLWSYQEGDAIAIL